MSTIDLTPDWAAIVPALCAVLENPEATRESKADVRAELQRLALFADLKLAEQKRIEREASRITTLGELLDEKRKEGAI